MIEIFLIVSAFLGLAWWFGKDHPPSRPSRETLNEVCPNEGTGDFASFPPNVEIEKDIK